MEQKKKCLAVIVSQEKIAEGIYDLLLETELAQYAKAGQFIGVFPEDSSTLLPRPISICQIDRENNRLRIVYRVAGKGTFEFSTYKKGDKLWILGILGNGFDPSLSQGKKAVLIGGGIGVPPILQLAKELEGEKKIILGYRDKELYLYDEFIKCGEVYTATEDGSVGTKGNVLDAIRENGIHADIIYACGPMPMLRAIKEYANAQGIEAYISLEEKMACGVGACLGCVCITKDLDSHSHVKNARICTDGPVFNAKEVEI